MNDLSAHGAFAVATAASSLSVADTPIGFVLGVAAAQVDILFDGAILAGLADHADPVVAGAGRVGSQIKVRVGRQWLIASVRSLRLSDDNHGHVIATADLLGEGGEEQLTGKLYRFSRGVTRFPIPGADVFALTADDARQMYATDEQPHIEIGTVHATRDIRASLLVDALLGKHFALLGSTGTGKSTATALILHRICDLAPNGHIVMIDPHGEYAAAFEDGGALYDVTNLQLPYWLMNFEEHCEILLTAAGADRQQDADILAKCLLAARNRNRLAAEFPKLTVDTPIPYLLSDLSQLVMSEMGKLERAGEAAPYQRLKNRIDEVKGDPRYSFMFSGMLVADTMAQFINRVFRLPGGGKPISIIDVSGVPNEVTTVVVAMLSRMVFDFAIWSRNEQQHPILLVCEEAHRYIPSDEHAAGSAAARVLARIAKEGRKYGVSLGLITQRPSDMAEGVLSQCGTIIAMRLNNDRDQAFVRAAMPEGARAFLEAIPALRNRECVVCGEGVAIPMRLSFDTLEARRCPASADPVFSTLWARTGDEEGIVARTIQRWRAQGR